MDDKLNERLRSARKSAGYTQKKMAGLLGISEPTMNNYEIGKRVPPADLLQRVAELVNCDPGWLLSGRGSAEPSPAGAVEVDGEFVCVPRYNVEATAGPGAEIPPEQVLDHVPFKADWIRNEIRADPSKLILVTAVGDSMEPTIRSGDLLLVDRDKRKMKSDGVFLLNINDGLLVKRVEWQMGGGLVVRGDNSAVSREQRLTPEDAYRLRLIGRVVWVGRKL